MGRKNWLTEMRETEREKVTWRRALRRSSPWKASFILFLVKSVMIRVEVVDKEEDGNDTDDDSLGKHLSIGFYLDEWFY